jgi:ABC-type bacteriocin/lantibiotic exporter with double-glycine peptidase domain
MQKVNHPPEVMRHHQRQILLDDLNIATLSGTFVRAHMAAMTQGPVLFSMSIRDNIRFASESVTV